MSIAEEKVRGAVHQLSGHIREEPGAFGLISVLIPKGDGESSLIYGDSWIEVLSRMVDQGFIQLTR